MNRCEIINKQSEAIEYYKQLTTELKKQNEILKEVIDEYNDTESSTQADNINHPTHYETGKYECIDVMQEAIGVEDTKGFCLCNAFKYIYRCTKKHVSPVEDVKKAIWYLNKFIELEKRENDELK